MTGSVGGRAVVGGRRSDLRCEAVAGVGSGVRLKTDVNTDGKADIRPDDRTVVVDEYTGGTAFSSNVE
ncbi:hypothetical protein Acsp01_53780 [Actinoplanes sp. NBRC 101535]|nr:hypothetical protein Acsp01_53780 [Actinoplanes sp. NBRC 101535]